jgi:hypothetical protein
MLALFIKCYFIYYEMNIFQYIIIYKFILYYLYSKQKKNYFTLNKSMMFKQKNLLIFN